MFELNYEDQSDLNKSTQNIKGKFQRDRHLASAIVLDEILYLLSKPNSQYLNNVDYQFYDRISKFKKDPMVKIIPSSFNTWFLPIIFEKFSQSKKCFHTPEEKDTFEKYLEIISKVTLVQANHAYNVNITDLNLELPHKELILNLYHLRCLVSSITDYFYKESILEINYADFLDYKLELYGSKLIVFKNESSSKSATNVYVCPYSSWLCFSDIIIGRLNVIISLDIQHIFVVSSRNKSLLPDVETCLKIWYWGDNDLKQYKEDAFVSFKIYHGMVVAYWLKHNDPFSTPNRAEILKAQCPVRNIWKIESLVKSMPDQAFLSLTGMRNHWGHPIVDVQAGIDKVRKNGEFTVEGLYQRFHPIAVFSKFFFIEQYFKNHNKWPKISTNTLGRLSRFYKNNTIPLRNQFQNYFSDFESLKFEKNYPMLSDEEVYSLLRDSAISPKRSEWYTEFSPIVRKENHFTSIKSQSSRRAIIDFLQSAKVSIKELIENLNTNGVVKGEDSIAILVPKERELSKQARMFVKLTPNTRYLQTYTEHLMSSFILKEVSSQTMTMGHDDVLKAIFKISYSLYHNLRVRALSNDRIVKCFPTTIVVSNDFSSWNLRFQLGNTFEVFSMFDDLHDSGILFSHIHEFTQTLLIIGRKSFSFPNTDMNQAVIPNDFVWEGQASFFEGMRQKCWTFIAIAALEYFCMLRNIRLKLICQGDNQLMLIYLPHSITHSQNTSYDQYIIAVNNYMKEILQGLESDFETINHTLKYEESWYSSRLCEYGRSLYLDSQPISTFLKEILRIHPSLNDSFPTVTTEISSISSSCLASCPSAPNLFTPYICSLLEVLIYLETKVFLHKFSFDQICTLLMLDASLGYFPISQLSHFLIRGIEDPVTQSVSLFSFLFKNYPEFITPIIQLTRFSIPTPKFSLLFIDPYCLNLSFPPRPDTIIRRMITQTLSKVIKNHKIKDSIESIDPEKLESLMVDLTSLQPFNPIVIQHLLNNSNLGIASHIVNMFTTTRSLAQLCDNTIHDNSIRANIEVMNIEYLRIITNKFNVSVTQKFDSFSKIFNIDTQCSYMTTLKLREITWGIEIVGVTKPSPTEQCNLHFSNTLPSMEVLQNSVICEISSDLNWNYSKKGPYPIYFSNKTQERIRTKFRTTTEVPDYFLSIKRLLTLWSWFRCPNIRRMIEHMLVEKCPAPLDETLTLAPDILSTDISHRLQELFPKPCANFNGQLLLSSYVKFNTTQGSRFSRHHENYNIYFQLLFSYALSCIDVMLPLYNTKYRFLILTFECESCTQLTYQGEYTLPDVILYDSVPLVQSSYELHFDNSINSTLTNQEILYVSISHQRQLTISLVAKYLNWLFSQKSFSNIIPNDAVYLLVPSYIFTIGQLKKVHPKEFIQCLVIRLIVQFFNFRRNTMRYYKIDTIKLGLYRLYQSFKESGILPLIQMYLSTMFNIQRLSVVQDFPKTLKRCISLVLKSIWDGSLHQIIPQELCLGLSIDHRSIVLKLRSLYLSGMLEYNSRDNLNNLPIALIDNEVFSTRVSINAPTDTERIELVNHDKIQQIYDYYQCIYSQSYHCTSDSLIFSTDLFSIQGIVFPSYKVVSKYILNTVDFVPSLFLPYCVNYFYAISDPYGDICIFKELMDGVISYPINNLDLSITAPEFNFDSFSLVGMEMDNQKKSKIIRLSTFLSNIICDEIPQIEESACIYVPAPSMKLPFFPNLYQKLMILFKNTPHSTLLITIDSNMSVSSIFDLLCEFNIPNVQCYYSQTLFNRLDHNEQVLILTRSIHPLNIEYVSPTLTINNIPTPDIHPFCTFCSLINTRHTIPCSSNTPDFVSHVFQSTNLTQHDLRLRNSILKYIKSIINFDILTIVELTNGAADLTHNLAFTTLLSIPDLHLFIRGWSQRDLQRLQSLQNSLRF